MSVIDTRVINLDELKLEHFEKGGKFACDTVRIGPLLGAKDLGYSYDVVPPGKRSCPFHSHRGEEEMFFVVRGTGTIFLYDVRVSTNVKNADGTFSLSKWKTLVDRYASAELGVPPTKTGHCGQALPIDEPV